jgi:hypothetical protein
MARDPRCVSAVAMVPWDVQTASVRECDVGPTCPTDQVGGTGKVASFDVVLLRVGTVVTAKAGDRLVSKGVTVATWRPVLVLAPTEWRVETVVRLVTAKALTSVSAVDRTPRACARTVGARMGRGTVVPVTRVTAGANAAWRLVAEFVQKSPR